MPDRSEIAEFLQSRRARLQPEDVGVPSTGERRRVPGLRRSELAQLAGVSVEYYTRLEQGRAGNVSDMVIDAIAQALRLDATERTHLTDLLRPQPAARRRRRSSPQRLRPGVVQLLNSISSPAFVLGRRMDVLAANRMARLLLTDFDALPGPERNMARWIFLGDEARELYPDWETVARETVAMLRFDAGRHPDDPELSELIGELSMKSPAFAGWWATHDVTERTFGTKDYRHPVVGELSIRYEALRLPDDPDQLLIAYTTEAGSPSERAMRLLDAWGGAEPAAPEPAEDRAAALLAEPADDAGPERA
jgi:transcriptional regulator with XRE-family HTH domain